MLIPILAAEAMLKSDGRLPVNLRFFFEGQEEIGSPDMPDFVAANADRLSADMIFSADGSQWAPDQPQIVEALRGLASVEVVVRGARSDQHSGMHGGGIANPAMALAQILASMKAPDGRITVEDPGYTTRERLWARPTLEINGLTSGWQGDGTKTVLPAEARAKITCRLVADQSPERIVEVLRAHVERHCPDGVVVEFEPSPARGNPFLVPRGHNSSVVAAQVLEEIYGRAPYRTRVGGSIPVMTMLLEHVGVHPTMFGFGHSDENLHAPDEFFRLDAFRRGQEAYCRLFERL